jgi:SAM-dependent methyltransferase
MRKLLNVGGGSRTIGIPECYNDWERVLLDIDPGVQPDIVCDARRLTQLPPAQFDVVYCAHNLEHYFRHEVPVVLAGFLHVLKPDGFAHIIVPDIGELMRITVQAGLDIDDKVYDCSAGPITVRDVLWGFGKAIEQSGQDFYAHKTGFTHKSLREMLARCGFRYVFLASGPLEIQAVCSQCEPPEHMIKMFDLQYPLA